MNVSEMAEQRKERPAYVRFERVAVEDKVASVKAGHYVARDVDMALITPPYTKDVFKVKVDQWMQNLDQDVRAERFPKEWADRYKEAYRAWQNGQEMPLHGTPIKGWGVISPAQQATLIQMTILTVEDLALINEDGIRRIGMGGVELKTKANAWLAQLQDKGPLTQEIAAVTKENAALKTSVETLTRQVEELTALMKQSPQTPVYRNPDSGDVISSSDILDEDEAMKNVARSLSDDYAGRAAYEKRVYDDYAKKFGKPAHHRMKFETIEAALRE